MSKHKCDLPKAHRFLPLGWKHKCDCGQKWKIKKSKTEVYRWDYRPVKEWRKVKGEQK